MGTIGINYLYNEGGINYVIYEKFVNNGNQKDLNMSKGFGDLIRYVIKNKNKLQGKEVLLSNNFPEDKKKSLLDLLFLLDI